MFCSFYDIVLRALRPNAKGQSKYDYFIAEKYL